MAKLMSSDSAVEAFASSCTESELRDYLKNLTKRGRRRLATHGHIAILRALEFNKESNGVVKALLDQPEIQVNSSDHDGNTALHNAVVVQNKEVVGMLFARADLDPNVGNVTSEDTPLHFQAALRGASLEIFDLLISDPRVIVAALNRDKQTPLHAACKLKNYRGSDAAQAPHVIRKLVNLAEAKLNLSVSEFLRKTDVQGRNALHYAAESGLGEAVRELLQIQETHDPDLALDVHDNEGSQAVHFATQRGHLHVVELLLPSGREGRENLIQECLQAKCSLPKLCSVLHLYQELLALTTRHHIAEFLLTTLYSIHIEKEESSYESLFHWAVTVNDSRRHGTSLIPHILKWRPEKTNEPLVDDDKEKTALHDATISGNHDAVEALCRANSNLDGTQRDACNNTALDHAFQHDNKIICRILLERYNVKEHLEHTHKNRQTYAVASNPLLVVSVLVVTLTYARCLTASEVKKLSQEGALLTNFRLPYVVIPTKVAFFLSMASTILAAFEALPFSFGIFFVQTVEDRYVRRSLSRTRVLIVLSSNLLMLALGAIVFAFVCSQYIAPYIHYKRELACEIVLGLYVLMSAVFLSLNVVRVWKEKRKSKARARRISCPKYALVMLFRRIGHELSWRCV